jgi:ATP/maltotriose-dependent transcriptional regulator MalT
VSEDSTEVFLDALLADKVEKQIVRLIAEGFSDEEIVEALLAPGGR